MLPRRRLRAIPPTSHRRPLARSGPRTEAGEAAWRPHIVAPCTPPSPGLSRHEVLMCLQRQIDDLTHEITLWVGEMGEEALFSLYQERRRLVDLLTDLHPLSLRS